MSILTFMSIISSMEPPKMQVKENIVMNILGWTMSVRSPKTFTKELKISLLKSCCMTKNF